MKCIMYELLIDALKNKKIPMWVGGMKTSLRIVIFTYRDLQGRSLFLNILLSIFSLSFGPLFYFQIRQVGIVAICIYSQITHSFSLVFYKLDKKFDLGKRQNFLVIVAIRSIYVYLRVVLPARRRGCLATSRGGCKTSSRRLSTSNVWLNLKNKIKSTSIKLKIL